MRISYKYAYLAKTIAITLFYLPIFPIGLIISFIGIIFGYLLELYNFTHIYKRPVMQNETISKVYMDFFVVILFIGGLGDFLFFYNIFPDDIMSIINFAFFLILIFIPYTKLIYCNFVGIKNKSDFHVIPFSSIKFMFFNNYQNKNPFTKRISLINNLTELKNLEYLSNSAYNYALRKINEINIMELKYQYMISNKNNIINLNEEPKENKKEKNNELFDKEIMKIFGKDNNYNNNIDNSKISMDTIIEENNENEYKQDKAVNMGLGPVLGEIPLFTSIYKDNPSKTSQNVENGNDDDTNNNK